MRAKRPELVLYAAVVGALLLGGCVTTKVSSFKDPAAAKYRSVAVAAPNLPLEQRQLAERAMTKAAAEAGVKATAAIDIFPPKRGDPDSGEWDDDPVILFKAGRTGD